LGPHGKTGERLSPAGVLNAILASTVSAHIASSTVANGRRHLGRCLSRVVSPSAAGVELRVAGTWTAIPTAASTAATGALVVVLVATAVST
jgi:hypothetical protein